VIIPFGFELGLEEIQGQKSSGGREEHSSL
jgi:hypothetical protein